MSLAKFDGAGDFLGSYGSCLTVLAHDRASNLDWSVITQLTAVSSNLVADEVLVDFSG